MNLTTTKIGSFVGNMKVVKLECIAYGVPTPHYKWTKIQVPSFEVGEDSTYNLINPTVDQFGIYQCEASNTIGFVRHIVNVEEIRKYIYFLASTSLKIMIGHHLWRIVFCFLVKLKS